MVEVVYITWKKVIRLCYRLAKKIANSGYRPEVVVSIMRGGVVPALIVSDIFNVDSFYALRVKHWGIAEEVYPVPIIEQLPQGRVEGRRVLLVDEVADTGKTLEASIKELAKLHPKEIRTAVLHLKPTSVVIPNYYAEKLDKWVWLFYPWSLVETVVALAIKEVGDSKVTERQLLEISLSLAKSLGIRGPISSVLKTSIKYYVPETKASSSNTN
ncbi:MAG: phosphoribosyltransferase [Sulfolobales archaeon]